MKKVFILFLMMFSLVPFLNDKIDVSAEENSLKHSSVNNSHALSYDVIIEDKIVNFNSEIYISFVLNEETTNYAVSLINASFIPLERIIEQEEVIDVYVSNNHEPGEHTFDINVQDESGLSFTQSIYELLLYTVESSLGIMSIDNVQYSTNGSYKLSNGTIILVEEDISAYFKGTLIFYSKDKIPQLE